MKKLYMIFLGGYIDQANIEVHDTQFLWIENIESGIEEVKKRWFGKAVHVDGYLILEYVDGFKLIPERTANEKLYMVVYGGYHTDFLGEVHQHDFLVGSSIDEAKQMAKKHIHRYNGMDHVDQVVDVFQNAGISLGLEKGPYQFKDNRKENVYHKIIDHNDE